MKIKFSELNFGVFDIESMGFDKFLLGGTYDGKTFKHTDQKKTMASLMELIFSSTNNCTIWYAHFGGIFDFIHVIDFLFSQDSEIKIDNIIVQGSKILKMDIFYNGYNKTFIDSSGIFPFSLSTLTKSFGVTHEKIDFDVSDLKEITPELIKYLKHDCIGLYDCIDIFRKTEYINEINHQLTRSGVSFAVYKKFFNSKLPILTETQQEYARKSYLGGRTEIFKPLFISSDSELELPKGIVKNKEKFLYKYDINSLYPSVMFENSFPSKFKMNTLTFNPKMHGVYDMTLYCPLDLKIPLLGNKIKVDGTEKLIFPTGKIRGHFCSPEINKALELGYKILKIHSGKIFYDGGKIFKKFVEFFYNARIETDDQVKKIIYKDLMNHLYGRLGINKDRDELSFEKTTDSKIHSIMKIKDYEIRLYSRPKKIYTYSNPLLASFTTSYARLKLYSYFEKAGIDNIYYCDTDSLPTTTLLPTSNSLGDIKLEDTLTEACFLLPKSYMTIDIDKISDIKLKGIPKKSITNIDFSTFVESISGELRLPEFKVKGGLAKFKTGMKKNNLLSILPDNTKKLKKSYDKRIIYKNNRGEYDTRAIHVQK